MSEMEYQSAAAIIRLIPEADRGELLNALPKKLQRDLNTTLIYPPDTVGAKMSVSIVTLSQKQSVAEALTEVRKYKRANTGVAFVVDKANKLLGMTNASDLLQYPNETLLIDVMKKSVVPLSARARLKTVASLPDWDDFSQLPVVTRKKMLIGSLSNKVARQWQAATAPVSAEADSSSLLGSITGAFVTSFVGLAQLVGEADQKDVQSNDTQSPRKTGGTS